MAVSSLGQLTVDLVANTAGFERGMNQAERAVASTAKAMAKQEAAADRLVGAIDPVAGALQRVTKQQIELEKHFQAGIIPKGEFERLNTILNAQADAVSNTNKEFQKGAISAKQYQAALRNVPAQFTDIAVSLASGQAPLTVLLQQGGQLKDMFGGVGNAAKALGGYVLGLVNPFTVATAAGAALVAVFVDAEREASAFNKALFSGSASTGQTAGTLASIAQSAAALTGNISAAREAVIALAATPSGLSDTQFRNLAQAAAAIGEFTGKSAADVAKALGDMGDNATKAAQKVSAQYGLITSAQYDAIKALDDQGKAQQANDLLSETLNANAQKRLADYRASLTDVERGWNDLGTAISNAYSKVKGELFPDASKQIEILERILKTRQEGGVAGAVSTGLSKLNSALGLGEGDNDDSTEALEHRLTILKTGLAVQQARAAAAGEETRANQSRIEAETKFDALTKANLSDQAKLAKDIKDARILGLAAGRSQVEIDKTVAEIQAKYDKAQPKTPKYREDAGQKLLDNLRQQYAALQLQSDTSKKLGTQAQALAEFNQQIADIKNKDVLTADQKSLLASEDLIRAQLKRNAALEAEVTARKSATEEAAKLAAFDENQRSKLDQAQQGLDAQLTGLGQGSKLRERLKEELAIKEDYQNQLDKLNRSYNSMSNPTQAQTDTYNQETTILQEALAERLVMQQDHYNQVDEASKNLFVGLGDSWNDYLTQATDVASQTKTLFDSAFGGLTDALYGFVTTGKLSFQDLATSFAQTALKMLIQYAAAQAIAAGLNAFTSTAAIPIVGPFAAPGAAATALAFAGGLSSQIAGIAGMAHSGIDSVPEDGTWLLQKGERVTTAQTSAKLDRTLNEIKSPGSLGGSNTNINLIEDASKAGRSQTREEDGEKFIDIFVSDLFSDGKTKDAMSTKFGLKSTGS